MLQNLDLTKILVLDIETVPQYPTYKEVPEKWQHLWDKKSAFIKRDEHQTSADIYPRAGIYAEFGKIICISVGFFNRSGNFWQFRTKSFYGDDEKLLLTEFATMLNRHFDDPGNLLCAHNGKEFDFPYMCRRMLINGVEIPDLLNIAGKKPWEVPHLDTLELWKFGDYKHYTSMRLLTKVLQIPSPKDDIDGSEVAYVYYVEKDIDRIITYCEKDAIAVAQVFLRLRREDLLIEEEIIHV